MKFLEALILIAIGAILGWWGHQRWSNKGPENVQVDSTVVLERIKSVAKLISVEGEFNHVFTYKDHYWWDVNIFSKQAIVKMNAKVMVGYDLQKMKIDAIKETKTIKISNVPSPEVLGVDSDLSYYDLKEGMFNNFNAEELTNLNKSARSVLEGLKYADVEPKDEFARKIKAEAQKQYPQIFDGARLLKERAKNDGIHTLKIIEMIAESAGWKVEYTDPNFAPQPLKN